jgi:hypothetical protein
MPLKKENREQKGKTCPIWGFGTSQRGENTRKGCRRLNIVEILYIYHLWIWKNGGQKDKGE